MHSRCPFRGTSALGEAHEVMTMLLVTFRLLDLGLEVSVEKGHELDHHTSLEQLINPMVSIGSGNVFIPSMRQGLDRQGLWGWERKENKVLYRTKPKEMPLPADHPDQHKPKPIGFNSSTESLAANLKKKQQQNKISMGLLCQLRPDNWLEELPQ
ncbi:hypothetical protein TURU_104835 [Turdus rufiventris]|nr:hypothetical protein TURU_104835 [Turdus rufiventris]